MSPTDWVVVIAIVIVWRLLVLSIDRRTRRLERGWANTPPHSHVKTIPRKKEDAA